MAGLNAIGQLAVVNGYPLWGLAMFSLGVAAFGVVNGSEAARRFAIFVSGLNAIEELLWIQAYPWSAAAMFVLSILVIYALAVYGGNRLYEP